MRFRYYIYPIIALFAFIFFIALSPSVINAQSTNSTTLSLTVDPAIIDLQTQPGNTIQNKFRVYNNNSTPITLNITPLKLASDPQTGEPVPQTPGPSDTYISWVKFSPSTITVQPGQWQTVSYTINVPSDAAYGYYYVFQLAPNTAPPIHGNGARVLGRVLIPALLNVQKAGEVSSLKLVKFGPENFINEFLPVTFDTVIENTGNIHVRPQGDIFIRSNLQSDLGVLDINPNLGAILPGGKRTYTVSWDDSFITQEPVHQDNQVKLNANGQPETHFVINWNKLTDFRIGKYTASLLAVYDTGTKDQTIEASADFWVVPYTAIGAAVIALFIIIVVLRFLLKAYVKKELRRQKSSR